MQNHIKGVHACGMALLAESATGGVFGMNLPDEALPLLKNMSIDYVRVAKGDLRGVATLTEVCQEFEHKLCVPRNFAECSSAH